MSTFFSAIRFVLVLLLYLYVRKRLQRGRDATSIPLLKSITLNEAVRDTTNVSIQ